MVRTGGAGRGWDRYGQVRYGQAVKIWSGLAGQGLVRLGPFRQGGHGVAWLGAVCLGQAVGVRVARPGVMRSGVATKAKTKVGVVLIPHHPTKRKEEKWKKELIKYGTRMSVKR